MLWILESGFRLLLILRVEVDGIWSCSDFSILIIGKLVLFIKLISLIIPANCFVWLYPYYVHTLKLGIGETILDASNNLIEVTLTKGMIVLPKDTNTDGFFLVDMLSSQNIQCNLESSSCKLNNLDEVSLRYIVEFISLSLVVEGSLRLSSELVTLFSWSHILKSGSFPWDEHGFDEVVDRIDRNLGSRMIDYGYIVLTEGSLLRIEQNLEEIYWLSMNEVPNLWCKLGSLPWDEDGFDEVVDEIDRNLGSRIVDYRYIVLLEGQSLRNRDNINDIGGKSSDGVINLGW